MAYQISPSKGSEYSVGWNFAIEVAKKHKVHVLCGASGDHMGDTREIEDYLKCYPNPNINLVPVKPTRLANCINWFNKIGFGPAFYLAFRLWHREAYKAAIVLIASVEIDVVHQLGPIGFREPGYLWKLDRPFVWGPIGGALFVKPALLKHLALKYRLFYRVKNSVTAFQLRHSRRVRKAAYRAYELVFSSVENKSSFEKYFDRSGAVVPEQGTFRSFKILANPLAKATRPDNSVSLVWAGRVAPEKNLSLLFHALAQLRTTRTWRLHLIGDGTQVQALKNLASRLQIEAGIIWHGKRSREETVKIMSNADLNVLSSLYEGNPAVLFEAISLGIPTISLDQGGMHTVLDKGNGILVPITTYEGTVKAYADRLNEAIEDPDAMAKLHECTTPMFEELSWERKISIFEVIYERAIVDFCNRKENQRELE